MSVRYCLASIVLSLLVGCATPPKERYYAISVPEADTAATVQGAAVVALGPVSIPEMVDRPQIVVRTGPNRMEMSELNRWVEPLKRALPRAIAANIARAMPSVRVYVAGNDALGPKDLSVRIDIERFESELGKGAIVEASWSVSAAGAPARHGRSLVREASSGPGYDELVAAHSAAAAAIGRDIAAALGALQR